MTARYRIYTAVVLALGVFARVFRLGDKVFWVDEGYDYHYAKLGSIAEVFHKLKDAVLSPLPNVIDHLWLKYIGESVFLIHLQTVIYSVLTLFLFAYMCRRLFDEKAAFAATVVFSFNAFLPEFAQTMRYFALAGLFNQLYSISYKENDNDIVV